jgi:hypothetical protein
MPSGPLKVTISLLLLPLEGLSMCQLASGASISMCFIASSRRWHLACSRPLRRLGPLHRLGPSRQCRRRRRWRCTRASRRLTGCKHSPGSWDRSPQIDCIEIAAGLHILAVRRPMLATFSDLISAEPSHSSKASNTRRNQAIIVRSRCVPFCGYCAGYFVLGFAFFQAQIWPDIEDFRPDPSTIFRTL